MGWLTTVDEDVDDEHAYEVFSPSHPALSFLIVGENRLLMHTSNVADSFTVTIKTTDRVGDWFMKSFLITERELALVAARRFL